jgi:hypothetical protein
MQLRWHLPLTGLMAVLIAWMVSFNVQAVAAQNFTVTATPQNSGAGGATSSVNFTVSNMPSAGTLVMGCVYAGASSFQSQAKLPVCGSGPAHAYTVTAGETISGSLTMIPWGTPVPATRAAREQGFNRAPAMGLALAMGVLICLRKRRRGLRSIFPALIAVVGLTLLAGAMACSGNGSAGVYPYTVTATLTPSPVMPLEAQTNTTVQVTVE